MTGPLAALITGKGRKFLLLLGIWLASAVPIAFVNAAIKFLKHSLALAFRTRLTKLGNARARSAAGGERTR